MLSKNLRPDKKIDEAGIACLIDLLTTVPPAVRRVQHFPRASTVPRVPAPAAAPAGVQSGHPSPRRSFLDVLLWEALSYERAADRAVAELR